jgi:predicted lipoprotein
MRSTGERRSWLVVVTLVGAALGQPFLGCGPGETAEPSPEAAALERVLAQVGPGVVLPAIASFEQELLDLQAAVLGWQGALATGDGAAEREAAQLAWRAALDAWQELELLQLGPAGSSISVAGGQDLRDRVYAWPSLNRCRVDQETVIGAWAEEGFFADALVNVQGLGALEALLFGGPEENGCPAHTEPNASGAWAALGPAGVAQQRAGYAAAAVAELLVVAGALEDAWSPEGGDFGALLASAGEAGSPYGSDSEALGAVFDALFYLELRTKDRKLARPLGLRDECTGTSCVAEVEAQLAGASHACVAANLRGFRALFSGGEGDGLDDLLEELGHGDLSDAIFAALDAADVAAAALTTPIEVAATTDPAPAVALHDAVKRVTDLLKGDLATVLAVQIPAEAAGDND